MVRIILIGVVLRFFLFLFTILILLSCDYGRKECNDNYDCQSTELCFDGLCFSSSCEDNNDCGTGYTCKSNNCKKTGYNTKCSIDNDCILGYKCVFNKCKKKCTKDADCSEYRKICTPGDYCF